MRPLRKEEHPCFSGMSAIAGRILPSYVLAKQIKPSFVGFVRKIPDCKEKPRHGLTARCSYCYPPKRLLCCLLYPSFSVFVLITRSSREARLAVARSVPRELHSARHCTVDATSSYVEDIAAVAELVTVRISTLSQMCTKWRLDIAGLTKVMPATVASSLRYDMSHNASQTVNQLQIAKTYAKKGQVQRWIS